MTTETIMIEVEAGAAKAYKAASEEDQKKIQLLLSLWLQAWATTPAASLQDLMDAISDRAQARGLTPELLESLLDAG